MVDILKKGWQPFVNLVKQYDVKVDGNQYRKLKKMTNKVNISSSTTPYWLVDEDEFKKVFEVE